MKIVAIGLSALLLAARGADDKEDLVAAAKKTAESKSYSFKGTVTRKLPEQSPQQPEPQSYEGKHDGEVGSIVTTSRETIVYAKGKIATCPKPEWRVREDRAGRPPGGEGEQPPRQGRGNLLGALGAIQQPRAPHTELASIVDKLDSVTKREEGETLGEYPCTVYDVTFTEEAARAMMAPGGGRRPGGGGGQSPFGEAKAAAKGTFWVDEEGLIIQMEVKITVALTIRDNEVEIGTTRTISLYDFGKTTVEIPEEALKAITGPGD